MKRNESLKKPVNTYSEESSKLQQKDSDRMKELSFIPKGMRNAVRFPLFEALHGRRARRFFKGAEIPDGAFKYKSKNSPQPLDELEQMFLLSAVSGNTGWHNMIYRGESYKPYLSNYSCAAGGRTFPSAAGFHTSEFFYTDDNGTYFLPTRDSGDLAETNENGDLYVNSWIEAHKKRIVKLSDKRLLIPREVPHMEAHNTWCVNTPGSTLIIPVADVAQHYLATLCFLVQNGACIYDDLNKKPIPGLDKFSHLVDTENPYPMTYMDQYSLTEVTAELSTSCYAGMLMLQAMGLGGWMFDGIDRYSLFGASGSPDAPGLGFQYNTIDGSPLPNVTGLPGVFEAFCPPNYSDMREAVEALANRKFGEGGPFNKNTPGPWKDSSKVRGSAMVHSEEFKDCVGMMAQYIFDTYQKFPATVPAVFSLTYLQAHHLDLEFYDHFYNKGAYLETHARHNEWWHR